MAIRLVCLKCKKEKELTESEVTEVAAFIHNKDLKAVKMLNYFNLSDGETCDGKEHRYGFNHEFLSNIVEKIEKIRGPEDKFSKNNEEITALSNQVIELQTRMFNLQNENNSIKEEIKESSLEILDETGVAWNRWI